MNWNNKIAIKRQRSIQHFAKAMKVSLSRGATLANLFTGASKYSVITETNGAVALLLFANGAACGGKKAV